MTLTPGPVIYHSFIVFYHVSSVLFVLICFTSVMLLETSFSYVFSLFLVAFRLQVLICAVPYRLFFSLVFSVAF